MVYRRGNRKSRVRNHSSIRQGNVKRSSWIIVIFSLLAIPLIWFGGKKKTKQQEENKRYDINEYMGDESL